MAVQNPLSPKTLDRLLDAIQECVWNATEADALADDPETEAAIYKQVAIATAPAPAPGMYVGLECSDCGFVAATIGEAAEHEHENDISHGGWDTTIVRAEPTTTY